MDLSFITESYMPIVLIACLTIGYILKAWIHDVDTKYIPTILSIVGAVLGCVANRSITLHNIVYGAVSGLASTGLHQAFKQIISGHCNKKEND